MAFLERSGEKTIRVTRFVNNSNAKNPDKHGHDNPHYYRCQIKLMGLREDAVGRYSR